MATNNPYNYPSSWNPYANTSAPSGWTTEQWASYLANLNNATAGNWQAQYNAATELEKLQTQIAAQQGAATAEQAAELARLQAQIASTEKLAGQQQTWQTGESAKDREAASALEALRQSGALAQIGAQNTGAQQLAGLNNAAAMSQLEKTLGSQAALQSTQQTWQSGENAAERAGQLSQIAATQQGEQALEALRQSGQITLAEKNQALQTATEEARYGRAKEQTGAANARVDELMAKMGLLPGGTTPTGQMATGMASVDSGADAQAEMAAEDAAFARAKDKIGQASRSAMDSMTSQMASRGITGSGVEAQELGKLYEGGVGQISDTAREQAIESLKRKQQVADRNVALASTTRGQNIGLLTSLANSARPSGGGVY